MNRVQEKKAAVTVRIDHLEFPTCLPAPPDPHPMFLEKRVYQGSSGKVYPLPCTDRIAEKPVPRKWRAVWIENEFLRVLVLPEIGGRIHAILDKTNGYDLIYNQPVIKPALVGLAGPWISGGIEFNWPQHHRPATFLPVDFEIEAHADGSQTLWCSDHDPMCRMKGMHGVCLHPGRALVELKVRAYNRTPFVQTFLWWANVATRVHEAYQSFFPPDVGYVADHARRSMSEYPLAKGIYYGVHYGERGRKGIPANEIPRQFVPPHCQVAAGILPAIEPGFQPGGKNAGRVGGGQNFLTLQNAHASPGGKLPPSTAGGTPAVTYAPNDLSFYANIPVPTSYMCVGSREDFFGGYDFKAQAGLVHIANHHISPGKKQWTWGNHEFGYAWDRNLTEADANGGFAPYIELMAGVFTDNQPDFSFLQPGETKAWSQFWYPIQQIGPAQHANLSAAVSLRVWDCGGTRSATPLWQTPSPQRPAGAVQNVARVGICVTRRCARAGIVLTGKGKKLFALSTDLSPGAPFVTEIKLPRGVTETDLQLRVVDEHQQEIISHQPQPRVQSKVPPPATEPPPPEKISSADELFITGLHLDQYRHATRCPTLYWREALRRDPLDARCNNAMGLWHLKRGEFILAEKHFRRAIARLTRRNANPADGEAYYNLGLCLRQQADALPRILSLSPTGGEAGRGPDEEARLLTEAYEVFYKSVWNQAWAAAGYHALAEMDCGRRDWPAALDHLDRSLRFNTDHLRARNLKVIVLRRLQRGEEAAVFLRETLALDPLDWWARHLSGMPLACDLQTALDLAHDFARAGFYVEAIEMLEGIARTKKGGEPFSLSPGERAGMEIPRTKSPRSELLNPLTRRDATLSPTGGEGRVRGHFDNLRFMGKPDVEPTLPNQTWGALPLVHYTLGWLHEKLGDQQSALEQFKIAAAASPDYCFPARLEEMAILEAAIRANPRDARAPYYLGNLLYDRRRHAEAIRLWKKSAQLDPGFSIVWRNLGIGWFNISKKPAKARAAYDRAFRANPADARLLFERDQLWKRLGEKPAKRLRELEQFPQLVTQRDDLTVEFCALLNQTGRHVEAMPLLAKRHFQPWEGGEGAALGQHVRTQLALGRAVLQSVAAGILPAVEPGFQSGGKSRGATDPLEKVEDADYRGVLSGRQDAALYGRPGGPPPQALAAVTHFQNALTAPPHLGEAKHLLANQSDIHYWLGVALELLGQNAGAREHWRAAANFKGDFQAMSVRAFSEMTYYSALSLEKLGRKAQAKKLFRELLAYARSLQKAEAKIDYFATSLPTMLLFEDDLQFRQETTALFLQAQARLGLGQTAKGIALLRKVLQRDPSHAFAVDLIK